MFPPCLITFFLFLQSTMTTAETTSSPPPSLWCWNGYDEVTYVDGDVYRGHWREGLKDGQGTYLSAKYHSRYDGEWKQNHYHGYGVLIAYDDTWQTELSRYEGYWERGERSGQGKQYRNGRLVYQGEYLNDVYDGQGCYVDDEGKIYRGQWKQNQLHGYAEFINVKTGNHYKGLWHKHVKHGHGVLTQSNGVTVTGFFRGEHVTNAVYHNQASDIVIHGTFDKGVWCGWGTLEKPGHFKYVGQAANNKYEGVGMFIDFKKKIRYYGQFHNHHPHGRGILERPNDKIIGEFQDGQPCGFVQTHVKDRMTGKIKISNVNWVPME